MIAGIIRSPNRYSPYKYPDKTNKDLDAAELKVLKTLGKEHARLIETHRLILSDPLITKEVPKRIESERVNAESKAKTLTGKAAAPCRLP